MGLYFIIDKTTNQILGKRIKSTAPLNTEKIYHIETNPKDIDYVYAQKKNKKIIYNLLNKGFELKEKDNEVRLADIKAKMKILLAESDYIMAQDNLAELTDEKKLAWTEYRKSLREQIKNCTDTDSIKWPEKPE